MGIRIIYGKPGSGKSEFCFKEIASKISEKNKIYMITPEQFSFTAEQKLMKTVNSNALIQAEVVTLSRMAYRVLNEVGGATKTLLSKSGKAMLIYSILNKYKKELKFLGKSDENIDLCQTAITEFKKHGVTVEILQKEIENIEDTYLQTKLKDITFVYEKFEEKIADKYIEETDLLNILAKNIEQAGFIQNSIIYLDEFAGFTLQEYEVIKQFAKLAKQVNITITTDDLQLNTNPDTDIFYSNKITISKIWNLINENEIQVEKPVHLKEQYRFKNKELKHLKDNLNNIKSTKYEQNVDNIQLFLAGNPYSEVENVAKQITKLIKTQDIRYKDIAIISKNIDEYATLIRPIFTKYEIPVFIDEKRDLNQNIIVQYLLSILDILSKNFKYETVFNYLKLGFLDIDPDEIFVLENYCIKWGIKQNKWKKEFALGKDEEQQKIERLEELRKQIINPLLELKEKIDKDRTVSGITKYLYLFLQEQKMEEKITKKIQELEEKNLIDLANEYIESYKIVIQLLDEIILVFKNEKITLDQYSQILKIGLKNNGLGKIPGTQDQVVFGDIERSRSHKVKVVFIIGLNDGVFPSVNKDEGFLDDKDRNTLKQEGIELAKGTLDALYEDNFNIYKAFTTAENQIFLSYPSSDKEGKSLRPSILIHKIKRIFPKLKEKSDLIQKNYEIVNEIVTYEELLENIAKMQKKEEISNIWYSIYQYYKEKNKWQEKLQNDLQGLKYTNLPQPIQKESIEKLYGNTLKTSVSRLEKYRSCPFSYYLQYGLKLKEKQTLKIQNFNTGTFMHETIDQFFKKIRSEGLGLAELEEDQIYKIVSEIIEENLNKSKNFIFKSTAKYKVLVRRLKGIVSKALKYIIQTLIYSDFNIEGTEVEFGKKGKYQPIILTLDNGKRVEITGKIDRIDTANRGRPANT